MCPGRPQTQDSTAHTSRGLGMQPCASMHSLVVYHNFGYIVRPCLKIYTLFIYLLMGSVCVCVCTHTCMHLCHGAYPKVCGPLPRVGSLLPLHEAWTSNLIRLHSQLRVYHNLDKSSWAWYWDVVGTMLAQQTPFLATRKKKKKTTKQV